MVGKKGFFSIEQYQRAPANKVMTIKGCGRCGLHKSCYSPKMEASGDGRKGILVIAEAPGEKEDRRGTQLIGKAGQLLRQKLRKVGISLDRDCRKINAINCRPPDNREPTKDEIMMCRPALLAEIKENKPKMIIPTGGVAMRSLLGHRWKEDSDFPIMRWRGFHIPDRDLESWISPVYHPSFVLRMEGNKAVERIFEMDLENAAYINKNKEFPKYQDERELVECLTEEKEILDFLRQLLKKPPPIISFDYETTGLKPHAKGHEIVCCSISTSPFNAFSFPVARFIRVKSLLVKILTHEKIWKIAANMKFEEMWTRVLLKVKVVNWLWDSMLAAHNLDNRKQITGLKFQAYVNYGLIDYDSHIKPFLISKEENNSNAFNRIHEIDLIDLLTYCGVDSMLEYRLAFHQMKLMGILDPAYAVKKGWFKTIKSIRR